jgi:hypothetical protein
MSLPAGGEQNPFDAREAAVFQKDESMQPVITLRKAYEKRNVTEFADALGAYRTEADEWIRTHTNTHANRHTHTHTHTHTRARVRTHA